jgi:hypothetical protein
MSRRLADLFASHWGVFTQFEEASTINASLTLLRVNQRYSSGHLHPLHGSPWHFSQGSWSKHNLDIRHLTENIIFFWLIL